MVKVTASLSPSEVQHVQSYTEQEEQGFKLGPFSKTFIPGYVHSVQEPLSVLALCSTKAIRSLGTISIQPFEYICAQLWKGWRRQGRKIKAARRPTLYLVSQPGLYHPHCQKGLWCIENACPKKTLKNRYSGKSSVTCKSLLLKTEELLCPIKSTFWQVQMKTQAAERTGKKPWELSLFKTGPIKQNFKVGE